MRYGRTDRCWQAVNLENCSHTDLPLTAEMLDGLGVSRRAKLTRRMTGFGRLAACVRWIREAFDLRWRSHGAFTCFVDNVRA